MKEILEFLKRLRANNNRDWFVSHREEWLDVKRQVDALASQLIAAVAEVDPRAASLSVSDCTYRIYRDTRFSADKTPYKTHIGIFINPGGGKKAITCGYYFHIEPDNCFIAAGTIGHPAPVLKAIRQSVYDEIEEYKSIVEDPEFRSLYPEIGFDLLKTAPKGFPKEWPDIYYLRPRNFTASSGNLTPMFKKRTFISDVRPYIAQAKRYNDFVNYTIEEFGPFFGCS